jgi:hypothetical protein
MHPAIFPELRIVSGGLPVKDPCNFGALDENEGGRRSPLARWAFASVEKQLNSSSTYFGPLKSKSRYSSTLEKCARRVPWIRHKPIVVRTRH